MNRTKLERPIRSSIGDMVMNQSSPNLESVSGYCARCRRRKTGTLDEYIIFKMSHVCDPTARLKRDK